MPYMKLGGNSDAFYRVCRALEATAGVPPGSGGDVAWARKLLAIINRKNRTDIALVREDYGYIFSYSTPEGAMILSKIKARYGL